MAKKRARFDKNIVKGLAAGLMLLGATAVPQVGEAKVQKKPKLVVWMVVDQGRGDLVDRLEPHLGEDGFNRLRQGGAWYSEAHFRHMATWTASGHASMVSGSYPHRHGIMANRWFSGEEEVRAVLDSENHGDAPGPWHLQVNTVADELHRVDARSKAVAVSHKDRAAVLMGGFRPDGVYWLDKKSGNFIGRNDEGAVASWVTAFNEARSIDDSFGYEWKQELPDSYYERRGVVDDCANESDGYGLGITFPRTIDGGEEKPGKAYYGALLRSPKGIDLLLDLALAAIEGEELGQDDSPDLLMVSISSTDLAGHFFGPQSRESYELFYHLDGQLGEFMAAVEGAVGKKNVGFALTADHGGPPIPECVVDKVPSGRVWNGDILKAVDSALSAHFELEDEHKWVKSFIDPGLYFNVPEGVERQEVLDVSRQALLQDVPGILEVCDPANARGPYAEACELAMVPGRGPDLMVIPQPYFVVSDERYKGHGMTHGSPHRYDSHVLLGFSGPGIKKGLRRDRVDVVSIAPTISRWLGVQAPAAAEVEALDAFKSP